MAYKLFGSKQGQGESLIKLLVVAIIAIIAIALAKSYFREGSRTTQKTVSDVYKISTVFSSGDQGISGVSPIPTSLLPGIK